MTDLGQADVFALRESVDMDLETEAKDIVVFDVPDLSRARELVARLRDRWICHAYQEPSAAIVSVFLSPDCSAELAPLLRRVEAWLADDTLGEVVFWLDGRGYVLRAGGPVDVGLGAGSIV